MQAGEEPVTPTWEEVTPAWEEARPPHLPDRITAIPRGVWPFVGLTILVLYFLVRRSDGTVLEFPTVVPQALGIVGIASVTLLGAALFLRHPDAWTRLRPVVVGVSLLAAAEAVRLLAPIAEGWLGIVWWDPESYFLPVSFAIHRAGALLALLGAVGLWLGLRAARRAPDPTRTRSILIAVLGVGIAIYAVGYALVIQFGHLGEGIAAVANAASVIFDAVDMVAWIAVASMLIAGTRARERPIAAWRVAAPAAVVIALVREPVWWFLPILDPGTVGVSGWYWVVTGATTAAAVLLLVAFLLGLPAPTEAEATEPA